MTNARLQSGDSGIPVCATFFCVISARTTIRLTLRSAALRMLFSSSESRKAQSPCAVSRAERLLRCSCCKTAIVPGIIGISTAPGGDLKFCPPGAVLLFFTAVGNLKMPSATFRQYPKISSGETSLTGPRVLRNFVSMSFLSPRIP